MALFITRKPIFLFILLLIIFFPLYSSTPTNEDCLACHEDSELKAEDGRSIYVDIEKFSSSIHSLAGFSCVDCHIDLEGFEDFPHTENLQPVSCSMCHEKAAEEFKKSIHSQTTSERNSYAVSCKDCHGNHNIKPIDDLDSMVFPLNLPKTCERCHLEKVKTERGTEFIKQYEQSIHFEGLIKAGLTTSSNCSNCHGAHDIRRVHDPLSRVSKRNIIPTCGKCHVGIMRDYFEGVHGEDYKKGSMDVPVCTDCHSEHDITSPQRLDSKMYATKVAEVCSRCHDDEALASQYGFITSRLKTFSKSFHGTASKFGEIRVANCVSCHGFHGIRPSSDPKSSIHPDNIPTTCGKCHQGAGKHFAEGKIHVVSEKVSNKWAYYIKLFYIILIISVISVMLIFIAADLFHRLTHKPKRV